MVKQIGTCIPWNSAGTKKEQTIETYNLDEPPENKAEFKEKSKRLHVVRFYLYNVLEMTRSWKWSTG